MGLTTEILIFDTSDAFRNDPGLSGKPALDIVLKSAGVHPPAYYGVQLENPTTGYVFLNWDSYEAHKAAIDSPAYPVLMEKLKPCIGGPKADMYHVQFSAPTIALEKPVTDVVILTLKAPENRASVVDILSKISEASEKMVVFGQTREDENKYILIGGWDTVEAHWETVAKPEVAAALDKLYSLANKDHLYHTKVSQYRL